MLIDVTLSIPFNMLEMCGGVTRACCMMVVCGGWPPSWSWDHPHAYSKPCTIQIEVGGIYPRPKNRWNWGELSPTRLRNIWRKMGITLSRIFPPITWTKLLFGEKLARKKKLSRVTPTVRHGLKIPLSSISGRRGIGCEDGFLKSVRFFCFYIYKDTYQDSAKK